MKSIKNAVIYMTLVLPLYTSSAPVVSSAKVQVCAADATQEDARIKAIIKKKTNYLRVVRLPSDGTCRHVHAHYISLKPKYKPQEKQLEVNEVQLLVWDGVIYKRVRMCDNCPLSPWRRVGSYPGLENEKNEKARNKAYKARGLLVCPDGSYKIPGELPEKR